MINQSNQVKNNDIENLINSNNTTNSEQKNINNKLIQSTQPIQPNEKPIKSNENINDETDIILDINADTETMNNQISNHMNKLNEKNNLVEEPVKKVIKINKEMLRTLIIEWLALDDQISTLRSEMKDKNEEKKQYEGQIIELMNAIKQEIILTDKGNISKNVRESKGPLTPELIKTTLAEILKSPETAETYTNHTMEKRVIKEKVSLKKEFEQKKVKKGKKQNK